MRFDKGFLILWGGDLNMNPQVLSEQSFIAEAGAKVITGGPTPTYVAGKVSTVLDY